MAGEKEERRRSQGPESRGEDREELLWLSILELTELYRKREVSPVEVERLAEERLLRQEPTLHAYMQITLDEARAAARRAEAQFKLGARVKQASSLSPLCGVPFTVKDLFDVRGLPTTCGSRAFDRRPLPGENAFVADHVLDAGGVLMGKTTLREFAYADDHPDFGVTCSPWDVARSTGGSSKGSAASVAAGQAFFSIGTETGASTRAPAAFCGLVGLKPTFGLLSRSGLVLLSGSCDHVGVLARTAADVAVVLNEIAEYDPDDPVMDRGAPVDYVRAALGRAAAGGSTGGAAGSEGSTWSTGSSGSVPSLKGLRAGVLVRDFEAPTAEPVRRAVWEAVEVLKGLGLEVREIEVPRLDDAVKAWSVIVGAEAAAHHQDALRRRAPGYSPATLERLRAGLRIPAVDYLEAQELRRHFADSLARVFAGGVDLLLGPTMSTVARPFSAEAPGRDIAPALRRSCPYPLTGYPVLSVPCGFGTDEVSSTGTEGGEGSGGSGGSGGTAVELPIGLQIAGRPWEEGLLLRVAHAYQQATGWHRRHPAL